MNASTGRIKKGRKFKQVLGGAREIFLRDGFEGACVDDIARASGVSKATLYSYFPDKRLLFMEVFRQECDRLTGAALDEIDFHAPVQEVLRQCARHIVGSLLSEFNQAVFRVCVSEVDRFPELGEAFYRSGPKRVHDELIAYLFDASARGEVDIEDPKLAAFQFIDLCRSDLYVRCLLRVQKTYMPEEADRVVDGAVGTFMARYGVEPVRSET